MLVALAIAAIGLEDRGMEPVALIGLAGRVADGEVTEIETSEWLLTALDGRGIPLRGLDDLEGLETALTGLDGLDTALGGLDQDGLDRALVGLEDVLVVAPDDAVVVQVDIAGVHNGSTTMIFDTAGTPGLHGWTTLGFVDGRGMFTVPIGSSFLARDDWFHCGLWK